MTQMLTAERSGLIKQQIADLLYCPRDIRSPGRYCRVRRSLSDEQSRTSGERTFRTGIARGRAIGSMRLDVEQAIRAGVIGPRQRLEEGAVDAAEARIGSERAVLGKVLRLSAGTARPRNAPAAVDARSQPASAAWLTNPEPPSCTVARPSWPANRSGRTGSPRICRVSAMAGLRRTVSVGSGL